MDSKIKQLKQMIDFPKLYLNEYYINLRNEVDTFYATKEVNKQLSDEDKQVWLQMINKIESIEKENLTKFNSNLITETTKEKIYNKIEIIENKTNNNELDDNEQSIDEEIGN